MLPLENGYLLKYAFIDPISYLHLPLLPVTEFIGRINSISQLQWFTQRGNPSAIQDMVGKELLFVDK